MSSAMMLVVFSVCLLSTFSSSFLAIGVAYRANNDTEISLGKNEGERERHDSEVTAYGVISVYVIAKLTKKEKKREKEKKRV